jgi:signal transduction histidine kinase/ActR/RegA family two-component response regulator
LKFTDTINTVNGVINNRYILSTYLPVYDPASNKIRAIFEIYADVSEMYQKIIDSRNNFALIVVIILGLVYTALFLLVRHADQVIRKQAKEREEYLNEIESINLDLDKIAKERARAHDKAVEANTYKSQFLANMSHELRTPLNAIIGYSEMLAEDMQYSDQLQAIDDLKKIQGAGKHLLTVINEILDISKIEAGHINLHLEEFDIFEAVNGIAETVEPLARKGNNSFTLNCPGDIGMIYSDVTRFRQILLNLLSNACKFTKDGQISLDISRSGQDDMEHIVCTVSDTGIGVSQENLNKIFKPFQQADTSTTREHGGTGLGLTISKRFCMMLGGSIRAESELNEGTRFIVKLPIHAKGDLSPDHPHPRLPDNTDPHADENKLPLERRNKISRVLLIDDDPTARELFQRFLEKHGFEVETAEDGTQGLAMARNNAPDLITLDVMLPGKDGWSVLQELKQDPRLRDIPVIMISIINEESMGYALGASDYLTKPINWDLMGNVIRKWTRSEKNDQ